MSNNNKPYRIGSVPFLNALPLIDDLQNNPKPDLFTLSFDVPSTLVRKLENKQLDVALASSFYLLQNPNAKIIDNISISSFGRVHSVRLFSKKTFEQIESLALDSGSMTSTALAQIILAEKFGIKPHTFSSIPNLKQMLSNADSAVIIGDAGMAESAEGLYVMDLGEQWQKLTNLPFVWALWIAIETPNEELVNLLLNAKKAGMKKIVEIAQNAPDYPGVSQHMRRQYLAEVMNYDLTQEHWEGWKQFANYCGKHCLANIQQIPHSVNEATPL